IPHRLNGSGNQLFQQLLLTYQQSPSKNDKTRTSGLTAIDYLANPIPATVSNKFSPTLNPGVPQKIYRPVTKSLSPIPQKKPVLETIRSQDKTTKFRNQQHAEALTSPKEKCHLIEKEKIEISVNKAAAKYNLPSKLIKAVIRAESNFNSQAVSTAGAQGLMQLMPATAEELGVKNPFDIDQNVDGGTRYLRKMIDQFGGDIKLALAAYNAGPGTVQRYQGNVPYRETQQYVNRVLRFSRQMG
ncbi:MAG: lytic transglycosylase domain-containing protein, partial [Desulfobacterales bacterium]